MSAMLRCLVIGHGPASGRCPVSMHCGKRLRDEGASSSELAERTGSLAERPPRPARRRWRLVVVALVVFIVAFGAATARLFVWPERGMPTRVSAIVMLGGSGDHDRYLLALQLAWQHRAPFVVISRDSPIIRTRERLRPPHITRARDLLYPRPGDYQG